MNSDNPRRRQLPTIVTVDCAVGSNAFDNEMCTSSSRNRLSSAITNERPRQWTTTEYLQYLSTLKDRTERFRLYLMRTIQALVCVLLLNNIAVGNAGDLLGTVGRTDPNTGVFPDSSIADFRFLLDGPAGKYGFLRSDVKGHFSWTNGKRARFWGVNISSKSVFVNRETIDKVVEVLARSGTNMVRLEAIDSSGGILDNPANDSSRILNESRLASVDYWIFKLKQAGIYTYLNLLDFRQFKAADNVARFEELGRAAKPYAIFDRRLIDLQKEYARQLLTHKNPLTNLRYVDEPAIALLEVCNEHGLFIKAKNLDEMVEPYATQFRQMWNRWLIKKYATEGSLRTAWGKLSDVDVLSPTEIPGDYSVKLPNFTPAVPSPAGSDPSLANAVIDVRRAPSRLRDGSQFLFEIQREYFKEMRDAVREIGFRGPITGVVGSESAPDIASVAAEMDFTSENFYTDHPLFSGRQWEGSFYFNDNNPLRSGSTYQVAPWLSALKWENKPVVVREWATVWPNRHRATAIPEMVAYASLQDFDAVLLFGYQVAKDPDRLSDFDHQADPPVWGLYAQGALAFLRGDVKPADHAVNLQYGPENLFQWPGGLRSLHRLAWFVRVNSSSGSIGLPRNPTIGSAVFASRSATSARRAVSVAASDDGAPPSILRLFQQSQSASDPKMLEDSPMVSDNGQTVRDTANGILSVRTSNHVSISGELPFGRPVSMGPFSVQTSTSLGAVSAISLDGQPLERSSRFVVKMVTRAENTGQEMTVAPPGAPSRLTLRNWGKAPVLTFGRDAGKPMILKRGDQPILTLGLTDGTWELLVQNGDATLYCDTAGIRGTLFGKPFVTAPSTPVLAQAGRLDPVKMAMLPGAKYFAAVPAAPENAKVSRNIGKSRASSSRNRRGRARRH